MNTDEAVVTLQYSPDPKRTDSVFHCWTHGWETLATVTVGHNRRRFIIGVNGEMRFDLPNGDVWRYTDDLIDNKIDTDEKLLVFLSLYPNVMTNNNWFEMYEVDEDGNDCGWSEVYETLDSAIEDALVIAEKR